MGWMTVGFYGVCALTAALAAWRARADFLKGERRIWTWVAILMAALCVNKQLDLQSLFTDIGRVLASNEGWYAQRRTFQKWFVLGVLAGSLMTTGLLWWRFRSFWRRHFLLASGLAFLVTFIVVRAISFHHVDLILKMTVSGVRMNWFLELGGIALIWIAALSELPGKRRCAK